MKNPIKKLFVILAIVMSFVVVQAGWAGMEPGVRCDKVVEGTVTAITETGEITVEYVTTVYGVQACWEIVAVEDEVVINVYETNNDKNIACYLTVNGGEVIDLRPERNKP